MKTHSELAQSDSLKVEINPDTLVRLLRNRQMVAGELKCLDPESRQLLRALCLESIIG